jgi:(p)ppGpp synthase/HD superfamily hydrolase
MKDWIMVLKAADAAALWHVHQRRKGAAKEPYINHLLEVAYVTRGRPCLRKNEHEGAP